MNNFQLVIIAALAVSELLALIPSVGSNSIFQLIVNILRSFAPKVRSLFNKDKKEVKADDKKEESKK